VASSVFELVPHSVEVRMAPALPLLQSGVASAQAGPEIAIPATTVVARRIVLSLDMSQTPKYENRAGVRTGLRWLRSQHFGGLRASRMCVRMLGQKPSFDDERIVSWFVIASP
jgi:hypothetical protein